MPEPRVFQRQGPQPEGRLFNFVHISGSLGKQLLSSKVTAAGSVEISQSWRNGMGVVGHGERPTADACSRGSGHITPQTAPAGLAQVVAAELWQS